MAIASAIKRNRQIQKRTALNRSLRSSVRTSIKAFEAAVAEGDKEAARERYSYMTKKLDTAAGKGLYHKNMAARKKARMAKRLNQMK